MRLAVVIVAFFVVLTAPSSAATRAPRVVFTVNPASPETGQAVTLDASASTCWGGGRWSAQNCTSFAWADDGDPNPPLDNAQSLGSGRVARFTFTSPGSKYIWLTVKDSSGRSTQDFFRGNTGMGTRSAIVAVLVTAAAGGAGIVIVGGGGTQTTNCLPDPTLCGFPAPSTTGVQSGHTLTTVTGDQTISTDGTVFEDKLVNGSRIIVDAHNVTIRNVRIVVPPGGDASTRVIYTGVMGADAVNANLTVDHVEVDMGGALEVQGIAWDGMTITNSYFHNGSDCWNFGSSTSISGSYCAIGPDANNDGVPDASFTCPDGPHYDGGQTDGAGTFATIHHNTVLNPCGQTSALALCNADQECNNVHVTDNLLAGGGYVIYCTQGSLGSGVGEQVTGNHISRYYYSNGGSQSGGPTAQCEWSDNFSGNVWDDTGLPIPGN